MWRVKKKEKGRGKERERREGGERKGRGGRERRGPRKEGKEKKAATTGRTLM